MALPSSRYFALGHSVPLFCKYVFVRVISYMLRSFSCCLTGILGFVVMLYPGEFNFLGPSSLSRWCTGPWPGVTNPTTLQMIARYPTFKPDDSSYESLSCPEHLCSAEVPDNSVWSPQGCLLPQCLLYRNARVTFVGCEAAHVHLVPVSLVLPIT